MAVEDEIRGGAVVEPPKANVRVFADQVCDFLLPVAMSVGWPVSLSLYPSLCCFHLFVDLSLLFRPDKSLGLGETHLSVNPLRCFEGQRTSVYILCLSLNQSVYILSDHIRVVIKSASIVTVHLRHVYQLCVNYMY